ncbi:hypothetical protein FLL89_16440 [Vibrio cholerae]|nr:hypothetical protein FLL89_16440 [Vibrio cholerae]
MIICHGIIVSTSSCYNKAFKSDSQRLAVSLRSSIAKRRSHLNAALCKKGSLICCLHISYFEQLALTI